MKEKELEGEVIKEGREREGEGKGVVAVPVECLQIITSTLLGRFFLVCVCVCIKARLNSRILRVYLPVRQQHALLA